MDIRASVARNHCDTYMAQCFRRAVGIPDSMASPINSRRMRKRMRQAKYEGARELMRQRYGALDRA